MDTARAGSEGLVKENKVKGLWQEADRAEHQDSQVQTLSCDVRRASQPEAERSSRLPSLAAAPRICDG